MTRKQNILALVSVGCLILVWCIPTFCLGGPKEELRDAENSYLYADYKRVLSKVTPLIELDIILSSPVDIARAYELGGLAAFYLEDTERASRYFEKLIRLQPSFQLDPVKIPPRAVAFFNELRDGLQDELNKIQDALKALAEKEREEERLRNLVTVRRNVQINHRLEALLPLGVGQFNNGNDRLGQFFFTSQLLTASASAAFFLSVESMRTSSGRFRSSDVSRAQTFRRAQLITGITSVLLYAASIVEGQLNFRSQIELNTERLKNGQVSPVSGLGFTF